MSRPEALRFVVDPPADTELLILTAVRQEAARQLGTWAGGYLEGTPENLGTLNFLHSKITVAAISAAVVDGMALCGIERMSVQERLLQVLKDSKAPQDARIRVIQWARHHGVKKFQASSALHQAMADSHVPYVQLSAGHALVAAGEGNRSVRQKLEEVAANGSLTQEWKGYARRLARGASPTDIPERTAGPSLTKVCSVVANAAATANP